MTEVSPSLSVITINVNELNCPIKRHRFAEWGENPIYMLSTRDPL